MSRLKNHPADISIDLSKAVTLLQEGGICAFPTDTIYGIGARLDRPEAIDALYAIKKRPRTNALIALCSDVAMAQTLVEFSPLAMQLTSFWPGALTLVLPVKTGADIPGAVNAGLDTLGVRIPNHSLALALIEAVGKPLATSSANISAAKPAMNVTEIAAQFAGDLPVLSGEETPVGQESTILKIVDNQAHLLRSGAVLPKTIERQLDISIMR